MQSFEYCGLRIWSEIDLPELPRSPGGGRGIAVKQVGPPKSKDFPWSHHWLSPRGEVFISYSNQTSCHWLRFPGLADFRISADASEITCFASKEIPGDTIRHLLLDQVLPRCLAYQGRIVLHGSAVYVHEGLVILLGESGAGKSTLAGAFHRVGLNAASDDCLLIKDGRDFVTAVPSYGGLRLWEDSLEVLFATRQNTHSMAHYSSKRRLPLDGIRSSTHELPVLAAIVLSRARTAEVPGVRPERLPHREAFIAILKQSFQLDLGDRHRMTRYMQALSRIIPRLNCFHLSMPHDYSLLPTVRKSILDIIPSIP